MSSTPSFGKLQQAFSLSLWSNKAAGQSDSTPSQLALYLETEVNDTIVQYTANVGNWSIVWGPAVYVNGSDSNNLKNPNIVPAGKGLGSGIADNAIYVAYNGTDTYVVAIAATNPYSIYDWGQEDFQTNSAVAFTPVGPGPDPSLTGAHISAGTALGVNILLNLMPQAGQAQPNVTLQDFLGTVAETSKTLIFAGHSLGGALSPTIATSLYPSAATQTAAWAQVLVVPTAGATPGDETFATGFNTVFGPVTDTTAPAGTPNQFNTDLWNQYDVVPHAWDNLQGTSFPQYVAPPYQVTFRSVACIFGELQFPTSNTIPWLVNYAKNHAAQAGVTYTPLRNQSLPGTAPAATISSVEQFLGILAQQHVTAYYDLMGVSAIQDPKPAATWEQALIYMFHRYILPHLPPLPHVADTGEPVDA